MADFKCVVCKHHYTPSDSQPCDNCEYIGDGRYSAYSPCTNADRIRSMTDEELAEFMCHNVSNGTVNCTFCAAAEFCRMGHNGWLNWLKQEAADEHQGL